VGPARMIAESLTPKPGIREQNRHKADMLVVSLDVRFRGDCVAKVTAERLCNNRIGANGFLNQRCALTPDLESILRAGTGKIVLQHNLPEADISWS
jgi:hypothetical protein